MSHSGNPDSLLPLAPLDGLTRCAPTPKFPTIKPVGGQLGWLAASVLKTPFGKAMEKPIRSYIAEFLGTFMLVFVGTSVATLQGVLPDILPGAGWLGICFAFGCTLMVLVLVIGPVSGCHVNPAVTIPMAISGRLSWSLVPGYVIAQLLGALVASAVLCALVSGLPGYEAADGLAANGNPKGMAVFALFFWELVMTSLFLFTIFSATRDGTAPVVSALAIGGFLFIAHLIGAPLGDASLNPARSFGPALLEGGAALGLLWLFIVAPILGGILGFGIYKIVYTEEPR